MEEAEEKPGVEAAIKERNKDANFDFANVSQETNDEVIARVVSYCERNPKLIEKLPDGSIYYGQKHSGLPSGCGFVAVYSPSVVGLPKKIE